MSERTPWLAMYAQSNAPPERFWRMSLKEWRALTAQAAPVLDRATFHALAARFPDKRA